MDYIGEDELLNKFRMNRDTIFQIYEELQDDLERPTEGNFFGPVSMQVTLAFRFYAFWSVQSLILMPSPLCQCQGVLRLCQKH